MIFAALRPLSPEELYFATYFHLHKNWTGEWKPDHPNLEQIKAWVRQTSKGLAEVITTEEDSCVVQFIHESVRDFLSRGYTSSFLRTPEEIESEVHELLKKLCYLQLQATNQQFLCDIEKESLRIYGKRLSIYSRHGRDRIDRTLNIICKKDWQGLQNRIQAKYPFLPYSTNYIFHHSNRAQHYYSQKQFLQDFPISVWSQFWNIITWDKYCRYPKPVNLAIIFTEMHLDNLIKVCSARRSCFEAYPYYGSPIAAAMFPYNDDKNLETIKVLLTLERHIICQDADTRWQFLCAHHEQDKCPTWV